MSHTILQTIREDYKFLGITSLIATFLYFYNLDNYYLGLDLADYPIHARHILEFGFPYILGDSPPIFEPRFTIEGIWAYHPWLGMYLIAPSIWLFGNTTFGAVFPTAVCGVLSIFAIFKLARETSPHLGVARITVLCFLLSVPCILYMRTSRYMGVNFLLSVTIVTAFIELIRNPNKRITSFCIQAIMLFYAMYSQFFGIFLGFGLYTAVYIRNRKLLIKLLLSSIIIATFTLPWFLYYFLPIREKVFELYSLYFDTAYTKSFFSFFQFWVAYLAEINQYFFPATMVLIFFGAKLYFNFKSPLSSIQNLLILLCISQISIATLHTIPLTNYIIGVIPLSFILLSVGLYEIHKIHRGLSCSILVLLLSTNWLHIAPYSLTLKFFDLEMIPSLQSDPHSLAKRWSYRIKLASRPKYYLGAYFQEIFSDYRGPLKGIVNYLIEHAKSSDRFLAAHEGDSIHFYTGLKMSQQTPFESPPEWIIPRGPRKKFPTMLWFTSEEKTQKNTEYIWNYIKTHSYEKIELNITDRGYENSYNMQNHLFKNDPVEHKVTIYHFSNDAINRTPHLNKSKDSID